MVKNSIKSFYGNLILIILFLKSLGVTGCIGSEDIEFTIMSEHTSDSGLYKWTKDGNVENIGAPLEVSSDNLRVITIITNTLNWKWKLTSEKGKI